MTVSSLERLAKQASSDPFFLGFRLSEFATVEELDDVGLASKLGCDQAVLTHLQLCRAPRTDSPAAFREDVECIASKFGLNPAVIAEVAKPILASVNRDGSGSDAPGAVLAARDRRAT